ncbi:MAG: hybrid sensor histidine kinase/response regulator [Lachnospiraceae bacterium]|nr:hybrid sensor histidine kinase/response regulator [Lachnospiraceae bacterium]
MRENKGFWTVKRVLSVILVVVLAAAVSIGIGIWGEYRDSVIDTQKKQLLLTVQSMSESMEVFIEEYSADLEGLYKAAGLGQKMKEKNGDLLKDYVDTHSTFVKDVIVENRDGTILKSMRNVKISRICSSSSMRDGKKLELAEMESGEMSLILQMGFPDGATASVILDLERYYQTLLRGLQVGTNGYMVLKDKEGIILMHPERAQWGIEIISGRMEMYEDLDLKSLETMIAHQRQGNTGVEEYYSYWWTEPGYPRVRKISAYCPVRLGDDFLILSAVMDYDDIYIPVAKGVLQLVLLFLVFFLIMVAMAWYIVRMMLQKQRDSEQIAYLTELNRILEEMHRSEETIAHQQRLQIMGTMTGGIAHEFNNLLTPIMGYADLLLMDFEEGSEQYDNAMEIYEAAEKAKEIIQQISSLSRKNMETAYKNTKGIRILTRALKMVRSVCPSHIHFIEDIRLGEENVLCNETQINQVILNVCVNGIHAMDHQDGQLMVRSWAAKREQLSSQIPSGKVLSPLSENWDHYVCIEIRDNGCGMSREVMNQIFDPFFTTKKGGKGTGLGLALVEQIINSHKGSLWVESELGKGSAFFICLPVNEQGDGRLEITENDSAGKAGDLSEGYFNQVSELKLLVVDDNPKVLRLLEKDGARIKISMECRMSFEEARRALEKLAGEKQNGQKGCEQEKGEQIRYFDALIADQEISGKSAVDFCMSIQGKYPNMIKIVMADQITRELVEAKQHKLVDAYVDKPVSISSILKTLKEVSASLH